MAKRKLYAEIAKELISAQETILSQQRTEASLRGFIAHLQLQLRRLEDREKLFGQRGEELARINAAYFDLERERDALRKALANLGPALAFLVRSDD